MEEADHLIINKTDMLDEPDQKELKELLAVHFADYPLHWISALKEKGVEDWFNAISKDTRTGSRIAKVDYDLYAKGEALMGWYNATFIVQNTEQLLVFWEEFNVKFLKLLQQVFQYERIEIGHMKTFLKSGSSHLNAHLTIDQLQYSHK